MSQSTFETRSLAWKLARDPAAVIAGLIVACFALMALLAPVIYPGDPFAMVAEPYVWPFTDARWPLGSDNQGRDVAAGLFHGASVSLMIALSAAAICLVLGTLVGALAGYFGGIVDRVLVVVTEAIQTMPSFLFLVVIVVIFEPSVTSITLGLGAVSWPTVARLVRAEFRSLRQREFVLAARGIGYSSAWIIRREILPNALPPLIITSSVIVASAILSESALAFLGLGDPAAMSWGAMIGNGRTVIRTAWYLSALPGIAILLAVLAVNLLGEALNDAMNPRGRDGH